MSICLECKCTYVADQKLELIDRIYCNDCNIKFEQEMLDRLDPNKMDIIAGKRKKPKRNGKYIKVVVRKKPEFKQYF
jgi:hypothetical protein